MDYQDQKLNLLKSKNFFLLKDLILSFLKVIIKKGKTIKYIYLLYDIFECLIKYCKNLFFFFNIIYKRLLLPIFFKMRIVAGKKTLIPFRLNEKKKYCFIWRLIIQSCKNRVEGSIKDRIVFELIDIFKNKGLTLKRRLQICKDIKNNIPNLRFLR